MPKNKIISRLLPTIIWLILITLLRWLWHWNLLALWLGGLLGTFLLDIDHLFYSLIIYPQEETSQRVKTLLKAQRYQEVISLLSITVNERIKLPLHSALFQVVFWVFCFWILSSTNNLFVQGLVMAMALNLLKEELLLLLNHQDDFLRRKLFWQFKWSPSLKHQKAFIIFMVFFFVFFNLFLI